MVNWFHSVETRLQRSANGVAADVGGSGRYLTIPT
jgi:hypothetical protein